MKTIHADADAEVDWQAVVDELALDAEHGDSSDEPTVSMGRPRERGSD